MAAGSMTSLTASVGDIDTTEQLMIFEAYQKGFVANGSNLKVIDFVNTRLTSEAQIVTNIPSKGDVLTQDTTGATMIVDYIYYDSTTSDHYVYGYTSSTASFNTSNDVKDSDSNTIISSANLSAVDEATSTPHWYDWTPYNNDTTTYGSMPAKAYLGCRYYGRAVLSGNPLYPHQWYMSRVADPWDWAFTATDSLSPVAGNNSDAGEVGDIVRALIPFNDDYLVFGCASSIHVLRGNPAESGSIDEASNTTGVYGFRSWCFDNDGNLYFWGDGGIYILPKGFGQVVNLSQTPLPDLVDDEAADPSTHRISMGYDRKRHGILVCITKLSDGTNSNYWYSLKTKGFYPETYPEEASAYSLFYYPANNKTYEDLLIGSQDGYIRKFSNSAKDDDAGDSDEAISSEVTILTKLQEEDDFGKIRQIDIDLMGGRSSGTFNDSDGCSWEIHVGEEAEEVLEDVEDGATAVSSGTVTGPGRSRRTTTGRGVWAALKLFNSTASETWGLNKLFLKLRKAGRA